MIRAILIDAAEREVREVELPDLSNDRLLVMNRMIGGYIELAHTWATADVLFVDEDGRMHDWPDGFALRTPSSNRLFIGSGIIVGREVEGDQYPDGWTNLDPVITADEVRKLVRFYGRKSYGDGSWQI
jgi:hypothetical protein